MEISVASSVNVSIHISAIEYQVVLHGTLHLCIRVILALPIIHGVMQLWFLIYDAEQFN